MGREAVWKNDELKPIVVHPVDKTDNYIKRCIAVAGDTLQIRNGVVFINSVEQRCTCAVGKELYGYSTAKPFSRPGIFTGIRNTDQ